MFLFHWREGKRGPATLVDSLCANSATHRIYVKTFHIDSIVKSLVGKPLASASEALVALCHRLGLAGVPEERNNSKTPLKKNRTLILKIALVVEMLFLLVGASSMLCKDLFWEAPNKK